MIQKTRNLLATAMYTLKVVKDGLDAKYIIINGEQVFKYSNNFSGSPTPESITLTATKFNISKNGKWQYKNTSGEWIDWLSGGSVVADTTLRIEPGSGILNSSKSMQIRYIVDDIYDEITIVKVSDGANGTSATAYWLISSASAIGKNASNAFNPTSITFTSKSQTGANAVANYSGRFVISETTDGTTFTDKYTSSTNESTKTYTPSATNIKSIRVRLYKAGGTSVLLDEQIIPVVIDGTNGASAVTAVLSNDSHNIPCNTSGTPSTYAGAVTTMSVFVGSTDTSSSWTYTVTPTNVTGTSSNNNRTFTVTGISADTGYVDITASRSGYSSVTKRFTVVKSKQGTTGSSGKDAYTVILSNESHTFPGSTSAALAGNATCTIIAYKGATKINANIGTISGMPSGMSVALSNNGTQNASFTVSVTTSMTTKNGVLTVPITVDGIVFNKTFSYSLALKGNTGATGPQGPQGPQGEAKDYYDGSFMDGKKYWSTSYTDTYAQPGSNVTIVKEPTSKIGGNVLQIQNDTWLYAKNKIAIEQNKIYKFTFRVRQIQDPLNGSDKNKIYAGATTFDANGNKLSPNNGTYFITSSQGITVVNGWKEYTAYMSTSIKSALIGTDGKTLCPAVKAFDSGTVVIKPMFIVNYSEGNGIAQVDSLTVEDYTQEWNALNIAKDKLQNDSQKVFDALTDNGKKQGIYMENDQLYINGQYLNARNLKVIDNNNVPTLVVDESGNVTINAANLSIGTKPVASKEYVSGEVNSAKDEINKKGYQTASQVQHTVDGLQVKISQSGGYNLIRNSTGASGSTNNWTHTGTSMGIGNNDGIGSNCRTFMYLDNGTTTSERYAFSSRFKLKPNTKYTFVGYFHNHTTCPSFDVFVLSSTTLADTDTSTNYTNVHHLINSQNTNGSWKKFTATFTTPANTKSGILRIDNNGYNSAGTNSNRVHWNALLLVEGELELPWSPHPSEVYDGITSIDKNGITVTASNVKSKTNMSADGFKITKTDTNEDVFKVNSDGTLNIKGSITVTGGSVPTSNLSGTISSSQLHSSIKDDISNAKNNASTALSTANTANSTLNSNKGNWSNAYNRVKDWANGAITGTVYINGGMISANTITANKMAIADFTNYCEMNVDNCGTYGFTKTTDSSASNNYWMKANTLSRDIPITSKKNYEMYKGNVQGTYRISFEFNSTVKGATTNGGTDSVLRPIGVGLYCKTTSGENTWYVVSCSSFTSGANKTYTGTVTLGADIVSFGVYIQINGYAPFTGQLLIRNIKVNKMANGELIVDGAITADKIASRTITADKIGAGTITANEIKSGTITASMITTGTLDASKVNVTNLNASNITTGSLNANRITTGTLDASKVTVTNLNASNIKSGKLSADYIDATNLSVKGELLSGQINGIGGMKFADGAVISSCESGVAGYKGIRISAPVIKLGDKVEIDRPTIFYDVTGKNNSSSKTTTWTMSSTGALTCASASLSGTLNVKNGVIYGMNNLALARGSIYIPSFGTSYTYDFIRGGNSSIAFADSGPIHFIYNGTKSSFIAGGSIYLPHAGNANCDHFRLGSGIMASPSSGSFHFLTASGGTSPLYAGVLYSATTLSLKEPMVMSNNSVFDKINSIDVIETKNGLRLHNPISNINAIDESPEVVKTVYNEEKDEIKTSIDYTSAIATLWKAVQELKQENELLKKEIKNN